VSIGAHISQPPQTDTQTDGRTEPHREALRERRDGDDEQRQRQRRQRKHERDLPRIQCAWNVARSGRRQQLVLCCVALSAAKRSVKMGPE
jgi:hypothetical protein